MSFILHVLSRLGASLLAQLVKNLPAMQETPVPPRFPREWIDYPLQYSWASLVVPAMQKTWVQSLDCEDPPEEGMVTHLSILAWRIPMDRGAWRAIYSPLGRKESDMVEQLSPLAR